MYSEKTVEEALAIISDYPLYAATSNVSAEEAIAIAKIVDKDFQPERS